MNKQLLLSSLIVLTALLTCNIGYSAETPAAEAEASGIHVVPLQKKLPPADFKRTPPEFKKGHPDMMRPPFPSKEEMQAKKAEIDRRLNLTEKQKEQIEKNKAKDREKIKPVMEKMKAKHQELHKIYTDESLTKEQKDKKAEAVKKDLNKLRVQADNCRKQNMKNFESVLTKEQKTEFEKIKKEQKAEMEKRRAEFEQKRKEFKGQHPQCKGKNPPDRPYPQPPKKEVK